MKATKICKICGNEYEYCHTFRRDGIFRWQDVACCVEHGNQYFAEVAASRGESTTETIDDVVVEEETKEDIIEEEIVYPTVSKKKSRK